MKALNTKEEYGINGIAKNNSGFFTIWKNEIEILVRNILYRTIWEIFISPIH